MVGLNHEFARELLWREYPTDQRGSYFRQFWDVAQLLNAERLARRTRCASSCYDIPRAHRWPTDSASASTTTARPRARTRRSSCS